MKKHIVVFLLCFVFSYDLRLSAQTTNQNKAITTIQNTDTLWKVIKRIYKINPDSTHAYSDYLLELGEKRGNALAIARAHNVKAKIYDKKGYIGKALTHYLKSVRAYDKLGKHSFAAADMANIGNLFLRADQNNNALTYFQGALDRYQLDNRTDRFVKIYYNLGQCYHAMTEYALAHEYFDKVLDGQADVNLRKKALNFKGILYYRQKNYQKARKYYSATLALKELKNPVKAEAIAYNNIGETFLEELYVDSAFYYLNKANTIKASLGDPDFALSTIILLSKNYRLDGQLDAGLSMLKKGIKNANSTISNPTLVEALKLVTTFYQELGKVDEDLLTFYNLQQKQITILNALNHKFELQSRQYAMKLSSDQLKAETSFEGFKSKQRAIVSISIIAILVIITCLVMYYKQRKNNLRKKLFKSIDNLQDMVEKVPI